MSAVHRHATAYGVKKEKSESKRKDEDELPTCPPLCFPANSQSDKYE